MPEAPKLIHEILPVGMLQCNCHVVGDPVSREAIVIDPGDDAPRILTVLHKHPLNVVAIIVTHAHIDHVIGLHRLHQATGAPVYLHGEDLGLYKILDQQAAWLGWKAPDAVQIDQLLKEGIVIRWGGREAQVIHTPGHSPGSICLYMPAPAGVPAPSGAQSGSKPGSSDREPGRLFAGDTLFAGSIGRTDLWGGSFEEIIRSLRGKLLALPDDTLVFPGHGESSTIGEERQSNSFLNA